MTTLIWTTPAARFEEAAPIGDGAIGGMVYGGTEGRIGLNDSTAWSGLPDYPDRALADVVARGGGPERLAEARAAVDGGDHNLAEALLMGLEGPWSQEFVPLGDLAIGLDGTIEPGSYVRELDLVSAVFEERFTVDAVEVRRTVWVDRGAEALMVRLTTSRPLAHRVKLTSQLPVGSRVVGPSLEALVELPVDGAPVHEPDAVAHRFDADGARARGFDPFVAVIARRSGDGRTTADSNGNLVATGATRSVVALLTETNGRRWWNSTPTVRRDELLATARERALQVADRNPEAMLAHHRRTAAAELSSSTLRVGAPGTVDVDDRIDVAGFLADGDAAVLARVLYGFGRYLLWSSSRAGSPPANLQGIWNASLRPPWSSNYTININTEMNYWAAERTGLSDAHEPLIALVSRLSVTGAHVARELYGARGWVAHHNTDPWGFALPAGDGHGAPSWAWWPMGGLWLTEHVWQHWRFGLDRRYLADTAWPILSGAAEFALDWLVDDGEGGLRTVPSTSPENGFRAADGSSRAVTESTAMDIALIRAVLEHTREAARTLGIAARLVEEVTAALSRLPHPGITPAGLLREWGDDRDATDPHHRHMSNLVGLFPLDQINPERTPELAVAASRTLDARGQGAMGWSWAWKIANRARLGQGNAALELFREATRPYTRDPAVDAPVDGSEWGGLLPNLFSTHPPFQIDGNLGFPAALAELLVGAGSAPIRLLPALPADWPDGAVTGLVVDGGIAVDLEWADSRPTRLRLERRVAAAPSRVTVTWPSGSVEVALPRTGAVELALDGVPA